MQLMLYFIILGILAYGGITDAKRREIPNLVPLVLLGIGILQCVIQRSFMPVLGFLLPLLAMMLTAKITKHPVAGGDFKLICTFGFATNLLFLIATLLLAFLLSLVHGLLLRKPCNREIPLCSYFAVGYAFVLILLPVVYLILHETAYIR